MDLCLNDIHNFDSYTGDKTAVFEKLALLIANSEIVLSYLDGWDKVIVRKANNPTIPDDDIWYILDPNNIEELLLPRTAKEIEII